ncbi:sugar transferase [Enterococcus crotali]|uniref:sugar transferase n=1 Tax=Enterococcus crotali TaxID=1453587 RepID=UPI000471FA4E|nr:sugar transferase [Enterococcus crotali]
MYQFFIKRIFDILISVILLPFICLICFIFAIAIKLEDGGSIFYNAERLGKNMKRFKMFKLRTMKENAPDIRNVDGSTFNSSDDYRVTKIGLILRKTSIDELPQLVNVLLGDMSLVGPRPSPLGNEHRYSKEFKMKFEVQPGITGLNQALLRNAASMDERMKNDVYYVENMSFFLDFKIILLTIFSVIKRKNITRDDVLK